MKAASKPTLNSASLHLCKNKIQEKFSQDDFKRKLGASRRCLGRVVDLHLWQGGSPEASQSRRSGRSTLSLFLSAYLNAQRRHLEPPASALVARETAYLPRQPVESCWQRPQIRASVGTGHWALGTRNHPHQISLVVVSLQPIRLWSLGSLLTHCLAPTGRVPLPCPPAHHFAFPPSAALFPFSLACQVSKDRVVRLSQRASLILCLFFLLLLFCYAFLKNKNPPHSFNSFKTGRSLIRTPTTPLVLLSFIPSADARPILPTARWPPIQPRRSFEPKENKILFCGITDVRLSFSVQCPVLARLCLVLSCPKHCPPWRLAGMTGNAAFNISIDISRFTRDARHAIRLSMLLVRLTNPALQFIANSLSVLHL